MIDKKIKYFFNFYLFFNFISLPMLLLAGDFKDGFVETQKILLEIIIYITVLVIIFSKFKITKIRYAIVVSFMIPFIIIFIKSKFFTNREVFEAFFSLSYLSNPLSYYMFKLVPLERAINYALVKLSIASFPFNIAFVSGIVFIFDIFCWYWLGRYAENILHLEIKSES